MIAIVLQSKGKSEGRKEKGKGRRKEGKKRERKKRKKKEGGKEEGRTKGSPPPLGVGGGGGYHWGGTFGPWSRNIYTDWKQAEKNMAELVK